MKRKKDIRTGKDGVRNAAVLGLSVLAGLITIAGAVLVVCSLIYDAHFQVLTSSVHGAVFGLVILFLGVRYCFAVRKLRTKISNSADHLPGSAFGGEGVHL